MSDINDHIQKNSELLASKLGKSQDEIVEALLELTKDMSPDIAIETIASLNMSTIMTMKTANVAAGFTKASTDLLQFKELFSPIKEGTLRSLLLAQEQYINSEVAIRMSAAIKNEVISGIIEKKSKNEILKSLGQQGFDPDISLSKIIRNSMKQYSKTVTARMAEDAPENTKYIYLGVIDNRTRDRCLELAALGAVTKAEMDAAGTSVGENGGWECRHNWAPLINIKKQGYQGDKVEKVRESKGG